MVRRNKKKKKGKKSHPVRHPIEWTVLSQENNRALTFQEKCTTEHLLLALKFLRAQPLQKIEPRTVNKTYAGHGVDLIPRRRLAPLSSQQLNICVQLAYINEVQFIIK